MTESKAAAKAADEKAKSFNVNDNAKSDEKVTSNEVKTQDLFNANDGIYGRQGGPYLDEVEQLQHEILSAAREGSTPNLDEPRSYPGIQLKSKAAQVADFNPTLIAGDDRRDGEFTAKPVATDVPVVSSVLSDFSLTDTEDKGEGVDPDAAPDPYLIGDPPVEGDPTEGNASKASVSFLV